MDLRDVVHRGDAVIELGETAEQLVDVDVLRPVDGRELQQNEFEVGRAPTRRARAVVDEHPVGEKAAQHRLELVVVRIDEARHDDAAACVDLAGVTDMQVGPDGHDLLALDQHVGRGEVADLRVHRHHRAAANDVAPARSAAILRRLAALLRGGARRKQVEPSAGDNPGRRRRLQEISPGMSLRESRVAQLAHVLSPLASHSQR